MKNPMIEKLFIRRFKAAREYRKGFEPGWEILTELYHFKDSKHPDWNFISFLKDYADSIGVRWDAGLFAGRQFFGLKGAPSKYDTNADNMAKTIQYQAEELNGLLPLLRTMITPLSYLGNVLLKAGMQPDAPSWSDIPLMDFWPMPKSNGIDKTMRWCIYRSKYILKELRELEKEGTVQDIDNIVNFTSSGKNQDSKTEGDNLTLEARGVDINAIENTADIDSENPDREYTILHMWEKNRYVSFEETSMEIISVADMAQKRDGIIGLVLDTIGIGGKTDGWTSNDYVDDKGQPYWPFVLLRPIPEKGVFYGMSPVEAHIVLQYEFNENRHHERITVDVIKKGIWLFRRANGIDESRLEKDAVLRGDSITDADIRRLDVGGTELLSVFERTETGLIQMGDKAAGIYDPQRGGGEGNITKTVGGLTLLIKEGNLKFARQLTNIHTDGLRPLILINVWLNQQFLGEDTMELRIAGKPKEVSGEQRQGSFRYEMTSAPGLGQQEAQQAMYGEIIDRYSANPIIQPMVKMEELVKKHLKASDLEPEDVMWTTEERDIISENQMLQEQLAQLQTQIPTASVAGDVATPPVTQPVKERTMV